MNKAKKTANNTAGAKQTTQLTYKELDFIAAFFASDFCEQGEDSIVWDYSVNDFLPYKGKIRSGVISSLEQKDIISVYKKEKGDIAGTYSFTENGKEVLKRYNITSANREEWMKDEEDQPKPIELSNTESTVLDFFMEELEGWKVTEPTYSNIGVSDVAKNFKYSKKVASEIIQSLQEKGLLEKDSEIDIVYVNWELALTIPKKVVKSSKPAPAPTNNSKFQPYQQYGSHGVNEELEGFTKGDLVSFLIKGKKHKGEYVHFHKNNHSPNGYIVIKYNGKIYERVAAKVTKVETK